MTDKWQLISTPLFLLLPFACIAKTKVVFHHIKRGATLRNIALRNIAMQEMVLTLVMGISCQSHGREKLGSMTLPVSTTF